MGRNRNPSTPVNAAGEPIDRESIESNAVVFTRAQLAEIEVVLHELGAAYRVLTDWKIVRGAPDSYEWRMAAARADALRWELLSSLPHDADGFNRRKAIHRRETRELVGAVEKALKRGVL